MTSVPGRKLIRTADCRGKGPRGHEVPAECVPPAGHHSHLPWLHTGCTFIYRTACFSPNIDTYAERKPMIPNNDI
jgi:hypothetical protein